MCKYFLIHHTVGKVWFNNIGTWSLHPPIQLANRRGWKLEWKITLSWVKLLIGFSCDGSCSWVYELLSKQLTDSFQLLMPRETINPFKSVYQILQRSRFRTQLQIILLSPQLNSRFKFRKDKNNYPHIMALLFYWVSKHFSFDIAVWNWIDYEFLPANFEGAWVIIFSWPPFFMISFWIHQKIMNRS